MLFYLKLSTYTKDKNELIESIENQGILENRFI